MSKVIKLCRKYLEGTYRAGKFETWRIKLVEKRLNLSALVRLSSTVWWVLLPL